MTFFSKIVTNRPWTTKPRTKGRTRTKGIGKGIGFSSVTYVIKTRVEYFRLCLSEKWTSTVKQEYESEDNEYQVYEMKSSNLIGADYSLESLENILNWIHQGTIDLVNVELDDCFDLFKICQMFDLKECLKKVAQCLVLKLEDWLTLSENSEYYTTQKISRIFQFDKDAKKVAKIKTNLSDWSECLKFRHERFNI